MGAALAARPAAPKAPLGVLLLASEGLGLVCFGLVATGVERIQWTTPKRMSVDAEGASSYRWSHGLLVSGGLVGGGGRGRRPGLPGPVDRRRDRPAGRQPTGC